jgi:hypothetical protein
MRRMLGHDAPPIQPWTQNLLTDEPLAECPVRTLIRRHESDPMLSAELDRHLALYPAYERGTLLTDGGLADQPGRYVEIMAMIEEMLARVESRYLAIREKQSGDDGGAQ